MMRSRTVLFALIAVTLLASSGCGAVLMTTPAVVANGLVDPFKQVSEERQASTIPVYVASARSVSGQTDPGRFYTNDRSHEVRLGRATVDLGWDMTWDDVVAESRASKRKNNPKLRVSGYEEYGSLWSTTWPPRLQFARDYDWAGLDRGPADAFLADVRAALDKSRKRQFTIFVHGFNTEFRDNLMLSAEFYHYMARDGVMMSFDWPSEGSMFSYQEDKANAQFAIRQFRRLVEFLGENLEDVEINIIAHSAGNPVVIQALQQLSLRYYDMPNDELREKLQLGRVVLAAPDMDLDLALTTGIDGSVRMVKRIAIYASKKDKALGFAADIFGDVRLGQSIGKLTEDEVASIIANGGQWIDATRAQKLAASSWLGHSYFHQNPWVSSDLMIFLRLGATAEERGLVRDLKTGFLTFPKDYEERLPEIVQQLQDKYGVEVDEGPTVHSATTQ